MGKIITHDLFLEKLLVKNIHFYKNEFVVRGIYKSMKEKILVEDIYGQYLIEPLILLKGSKPSIKSAINKTEHWINRAQKIHNYKYNYNKSIYTYDYNNITITCKIHGNFSIRCSAHLSGQGCKKCYVKNITHDLNTFIIKADIVHNNKYSYKNAKYITSKNCLKITCLEHGDFLQTPNSHLSGQGCPKCHLMYNSFKKEQWITKGKNKKGIFYIIKCFNDTETFYKLGITFRSIIKRYRLNDKKAMPYNYKIIKEVKSKNLSYIWDLEKRFKRIKQNNHYIPLIEFSGCKTECFKQ